MTPDVSLEQCILKAEQQKHGLRSDLLRKIMEAESDEVEPMVADRRDTIDEALRARVESHAANVIDDFGDDVFTPDMPAAAGQEEPLGDLQTGGAATAKLTTSKRRFDFPENAYLNTHSRLPRLSTAFSLPKARNNDGDDQGVPPKNLATSSALAARSSGRAHEHALRDVDRPRSKGKLPEREADANPADDFPEELHWSILEKDLKTLYLKNKSPQKNMMPLQKTTIPEQQTTISEQQTTIPEQEATIPEQEATIPEQEATIPEQEATVSAQEASSAPQTVVNRPRKVAVPAYNDYVTPFFDGPVEGHFVLHGHLPFVASKGNTHQPGQLDILDEFPEVLADEIRKAFEDRMADRATQYERDQSRHAICWTAYVMRRASQSPPSVHTLLRPGMYACRVCANSRRVCVIVVEGYLVALPLPPKARGRVPSTDIRYFVADKELITKSIQGVWPRFDAA